MTNGARKNQNDKQILPTTLGHPPVNCGFWRRRETLARYQHHYRPNTPRDVIIRYISSPTTLDHDIVIRAGGILIRTLPAIDAAVYTVPPAALTGLAEQPRVLRITADRKVQPRLDYTAAAVGAAAAWSSGLTGSGVAVAVVDSGITPDPDFTTGSGNRIVYSEAFGLNGTTDRYGHGTHVAGIIAGDGRMSACPGCTRSFLGIAPAASLVNLRVLNDAGVGSDSAVIAAIGRAIELKDRYNIRVLNLSLGRPVYESYHDDPLCQAVEAAWRAGITVVVAAGNSGRDNSRETQGYGTINSPANDPYVITVGAMKTGNTLDSLDDLVASYSSKGPTQVDHVAKPDLVAPGNRIVSLKAPGSTLAKSADQFLSMPGRVDAHYVVLSGTSMAAATVSGAVVDLLSAHPQLTPDQIKARLMRNAAKIARTLSTATIL